MKCVVMSALARAPAGRFPAAGVQPVVSGVQSQGARTRRQRLLRQRRQRQLPRLNLLVDMQARCQARVLSLCWQ